MSRTTVTDEVRVSTDDLYAQLETCEDTLSEVKARRRVNWQLAEDVKYQRNVVFDRIIRRINETLTEFLTSSNDTVMVTNVDRGGASTANTTIDGVWLPGYPQQNTDGNSIGYFYGSLEYAKGYFRKPELCFLEKAASGNVTNVRILSRQYVVNIWPYIKGSIVN